MKGERSEPELEFVGRLMSLCARYGLQELEVRENGLHVTLRADPFHEEEEQEEAPGGRAYLWRPPLWADLPKESEPRSTRPETARPLYAPLTGTFYRAEKPGVPNFVETGDTVEEGQQIGIIEAMKVFTPILADRSGVVVEIMVQNQSPVQHGDVLLWIDPMLAT
jgi:acetyl-CoA carboxylase biotin carboxyl carrier protein